MLDHGLSGLFAVVGFVSTQMLRFVQGGLGTCDHDAVKDTLRLGDVMSIGSGHDERQRDATPVHQQMALAPIFSPDPLGSAQRFVTPLALSSSRHQCFAIARRCLQARRTRQVPVSTGLQRRRLSPTQGIGRVLRWHCRSAQRGAPSTGSLCVEQTRCLQIPIGDLGFSSAPALSGVGLISKALTHRDQRLNTTPEFIGDFPCFCL